MSMDPLALMRTIAALERELDRLRGGDAAAPGRANLLANGGLRRWTRGAGPWTANNAWMADDWQLVVTAGSVSASRVTPQGLTATAANPYALQMVVSGATPNVSAQATVGDVAPLLGRRVALSLWAYATTPGACYAALFDDVGGAASAGHPGGGWQALTVVLDVSTTTVGLTAALVVQAASTVQLGWAMLAASNVPVMFAPLHPADVAARCLRRVEKWGGGGAFDFPSLYGYGAAGQFVLTPVTFLGEKAGIPTVTKSGTWAVANCGQPSAIRVSPRGVTLAVQVTALGSYVVDTDSTDDSFLFEV
jgi:hypothetical protein